MTKNQFISILSKELKDIPQKDKKEVLEDYEEHFILGIEQKRKEEEIAKSLGNPKVLAKLIKTEFAINNAEKNTTINNIFKLIITSTGLGFFNLFFIPIVFLGGESLILALYSIVLGIFASGLALALSPILKIFFYNIHNPLNPILSIILGILITFLGYYLFKISNNISKKFNRFLLRYVKTNINILKNSKQS